MIDPEIGTVVTFNGEIYNYRELRALLEQSGMRFHTASDVEVLLLSYRRWGVGMFERLNGMFAFALYDPREGTVLLARDRFGVKPLSYAFVGDRLIFASEPKALIALEPELREPDTNAIRAFFVDSTSFDGERTFYRDIKSLPPASYALYRKGDAVLYPQRYWAYPEPQPAGQTAARAAEEFAALFEDAVRLRLDCEPKKGLLLSGGLDSTAILAAAGRIWDLDCFTSTYSDPVHGEEKWARLAASLAGRSLTCVRAADENWFGTLQSIVWHMDGPGASPAVFPLWCIMQRAREDGVRVILDGQGADELLGGYSQHAPRALLQFMGQAFAGRAPFAALATQMRGSVETFGGTLMAMRHAQAALGGLYPKVREAWGRGNEFHAPRGEPSGPANPDKGAASRRGPLFQALLRDHASASLPQLLQYGDSMSMAHGIEMRDPFMDYRLVEWVFRNEPPVIHDGKTKYPVYAFLNEKGFEPIANRRRKEGYPTAIRSWLRTERRRFRDMVDDRNAPVWRYLDRRAAARRFDAAIRGAPIAMYNFYKTVSLQCWLTQMGGAGRESAVATDSGPPVSLVEHA